MESYFKRKDISFFTATEAAKFLNISTVTLKKYINKNKIKAYKTPGGHYRIQKRDLVESFYNSVHIN